MRRRPLLVIVLTFLSLLLLPTFALAKRPTVAARSPATLRATADDGADSVATIKKGDMLTILGTSGDWSNVQTAAGKKGYVKTSVVSEKKSLGTEGTVIAANENSDETAIRGKGIKRKTLVVASGDLKTIAAKLGGLPQVAVVGSEATGFPASLDEAKKMGDAKKADLVVGVSETYGANPVRIFDLKNGKELTASAVDAKSKTLPADVARAVSDALIEAAKAATAASPAASPAAAASNEACVKECLEKSQMKAMTIESIKADCEKTCAGGSK